MLTHREGRHAVRDRLTALLLLTALLHAIVLLGLSFSDGAPLGAPSPRLDVLLVTDEVPEARTNDQAAYLAQRTQIGAGNITAPRPIASPASRGAPPRPRSDEGVSDQRRERLAATSVRDVLSSTAENADIRYVGALSAAGAAAAIEAPVSGDTEGEPRSGRGDGAQLLLKGRADAQHWVTPDTRASKLAPYLAAWKRKIERIGNLNYPTAAHAAGLSGSPIIEVQIGANGTLVDASVRRGSGYATLDEAALRIVHLASPFDPFPPDLASDYARLRFAYQWDFVAGTLQTGAVTVSSDRTSGP